MNSSSENGDYWNFPKSKSKSLLANMMKLIRGDAFITQHMAQAQALIMQIIKIKWINWLFIRLNYVMSRSKMFQILFSWTII